MTLFKDSMICPYQLSQDSPLRPKLFLDNTTSSYRIRRVLWRKYTEEMLGDKFYENCRKRNRG